jgi:hypothetical protein
MAEQNFDSAAAQSQRSTQAQNLVSFFVAIETLSIPLYVLCGTNLRRAESFESGLKYLIIGSLGSATLLYGLAFVYGGSGSTDFTRIASGLGEVEPGLGEDQELARGVGVGLEGGRGQGRAQAGEPRDQGGGVEIEAGGAPPVDGHAADGVEAVAQAAGVDDDQVGRGVGVDPLEVDVDRRAQTAAERGARCV